jgi:hypothetical protein
MLAPQKARQMIERFEAALQRPVRKESPTVVLYGGALNRRGLPTARPLDAGRAASNHAGKWRSASPSTCGRSASCWMPRLRLPRVSRQRRHRIGGGDSQ